MTCRYCLQRPAQQKSDSGTCPECWWYLEPLKIDAPAYYALLRRLANLRWAQREAVALPSLWSYGPGFLRAG